jgi:CheY-like chemotaxis protein
MEKKYILLVEDNVVAIKIAEKMLKLLGCEVDCAVDGDEAIELAIANHYDGICMDIGLPKVSGDMASKAIRGYEAEHLKPVPIIALTGNNAPDEIAKYLEAGMQKVFSKPFTIEKAKEFLSLCN